MCVSIDRKEQWVGPFVLKCPKAKFEYKNMIKYQIPLKVVANDPVITRAQTSEQMARFGEGTTVPPDFGNSTLSKQSTAALL